MSKRTIETDAAPTAIGAYSQAIIANGFIFTAGQIGLDPATGVIVEGGVALQAERVMANLNAVLTAGNSSFNAVVKTTIYLANINDFAKVNEIYAKAMGGAMPARSTIEAGALPLGALVEIDMIAMVRE